MRGRRSTTLALAAWLIALAGCSVRVVIPTAPSAPPSQPVPTLPTKAWEVLAADDFERADLGKGWATTAGSWTVEDGALKGSLVADPSGINLADLAWQGGPLPPTVEILYETWSPGPVGSEAKLLDPGQTQGLIMALYGTPHPALGSKGAVVFLQAKPPSVQFQALAANRAFDLKPGVRHKVRIVRQPEGVTVFVDGVKVVSAAPGTRPEGSTPVLHLVGTFGAPGSVVYFDNFEIRVPPTKEDPAR
jgi:hypothetical protein